MLPEGGQGPRPGASSSPHDEKRVLPHIHGKYPPTPPHTHTHTHTHTHKHAYTHTHTRTHAHRKDASSRTYEKESASARTVSFHLQSPNATLPHTQSRTDSLSRKHRVAFGAPARIKFSAASSQIRVKLGLYGKPSQIRALLEITLGGHIVCAPPDAALDRSTALIHGCWLYLRIKGPPPSHRSNSSLLLYYSPA